MHSRTDPKSRPRLELCMQCNRKRLFDTSRCVFKNPSLSLPLSFAALRHNCFLEGAALAHARAVVKCQTGIEVLLCLIQLHVNICSPMPAPCFHYAPLGCLLPPRSDGARKASSFPRCSMGSASMHTLGFTSRPVPTRHVFPGLGNIFVDAPVVVEFVARPQMPAM